MNSGADEAIRDGLRILIGIALLTAFADSNAQSRCDDSQLRIRYSIERIVPADKRVIVRTKDGVDIPSDRGGCLKSGEALIIPNDVSLVYVFDGVDTRRIRSSEKLLVADDRLGAQVEEALRWVDRALGAWRNSTSHDLPKHAGPRGDEKDGRSKPLRPIASLGTTIGAQLLPVGRTNIIVSWREGRGPKWGCSARRTLENGRVENPIIDSTRELADQWCLLNIQRLQIGDKVQASVTDAEGTTVFWTATALPAEEVPRPNWISHGAEVSDPFNRTAWALWLLHTHPPWRLYAVAELQRLSHDVWLAGHVLRRLLNEDYEIAK